MCWLFFQHLMDSQDLMAYTSNWYIMAEVLFYITPSLSNKYKEALKSWRTTSTEKDERLRVLTKRIK